MAPLFPETAKATGATGWTTFPQPGTVFWWNLVTSIIMGVGIGAIAQPQLAVRFMTVNSNKELNNQGNSINNIQEKINNTENTTDKTGHIICNLLRG